jgi:hypothetical protein
MPVFDKFCVTPSTFIDPEASGGISCPKQQVAVQLFQTERVCHPAAAKPS